MIKILPIPSRFGAFADSTLPIRSLQRLGKATLGLSLILLGTVASNAAVLSKASNDLFIGFRAVTGATSGGAPIDGKIYLLNIGLYSKYSAGSSFTLNNTNTPGLNSILTDLSGQFGPDWYTAGNVLWGIAGSQTANGGALYASESRPDAATQSTPWPVLSDAGVRNGVRASIDSGVSGYNGGTSTANSNLGFFQNSSLAGGWKEQVTFAGPDFGDQSSWTSVESSLTNSLDLWRITGTTSTSPGYFSINGSAGISFTATPVPEPSTTAYIALVGGVALVVWNRRRSAKPSAV